MTLVSSRIKRLIFISAAKILETRGWCRHYDAITSDGNSTRFDDNSAAHFSLTSSIRLATLQLNILDENLVKELFEVVRSKTRVDLTLFNDEAASVRDITDVLLAASNDFLSAPMTISDIVQMNKEKQSTFADHMNTSAYNSLQLPAKIPFKPKEVVEWVNPSYANYSLGDSDEA